MSTLTFDEKDTATLKTWIVSRLEDISDADSDVLADYVLALIKSDDPEEQARANCVENLEDFLKEHTQKFVDDVFRAVRDKSYLPSYVAPKSGTHSKPQYNPQTRPFAPQNPQQYAQPSLPSFSAPSGSSQTPFAQAQSMNGSSSLPGGSSELGNNQSRKRGRDESDNYDPSSAGQYSDRVQKQRRRGGPNMRGGRGDAASRGFQQMPPMPPMPQLPAGFPQFDPNNPMAAMMAMQAMGMPPLPDFGQFQDQNSSASQQQSTGQRQGKPKQRCRDYDTKGYCAAGSKCPYEHGEDPIVVGSQATDANSTSYTPSSPGHQSSPPPNTRGSSRGGYRGNRGRKGPDSGRGGRAPFSAAGPNSDTRITSVVVEQIPEDKFSDEEIRNFFHEFGDIEEITMQPYKRLAIIKFKDHAGAKKAYESPKVIFDNRFVKVYWYKPDATQQNGHHRPSSAAAKYGAQTNADDKTEDQEMLDPEEFAKKQAEAQQAHEERMKKVREAETARDELDKQIKAQAEERRKLMEKLAAKTGTTSDPMSSISPAPDTKSGSSPPASGVGATAGAQTEKEKTTESLRAKLAELEAEAANMVLNPEDSAQTSSSDWYGARGRGRGAYRGGYRGFDPSYRGRGRGGWRGGYQGAPSGGAVARLDNRPRNVKVIALDEGVDFGDDAIGEALRSHLYGIGPFASIQPPADDNAAAATNGEPQGDNEEKPMHSKERIVSFHERYVAEIFIASAQPTGGTIPGVGKVEMSWVANSAVPAPPAGASPTTTSAIPATPGAVMESTVNVGGNALPGISAPAAATKTATNGVPDHPTQSVKDTSNNGAAREDDYDVADDEDDDRWMMA